MSEQVSRWIESFSKWHPKVMLHGIKVSPCSCGCGKEDYIIPRLGPLCELAAANKDCWEFIWDANDEKWSCVRV
jgi:hypothetical protein